LLYIYMDKLIIIDQGNQMQLQQYLLQLNPMIKMIFDENLYIVIKLDEEYFTIYLILRNMLLYVHMEDILMKDNDVQ
jgi:hypothetical protein